MRKQSILITCLFLFAVAVQAQWQKMDAPAHYFVSGVARFGPNQYASSREVVYARVQNTAAWTKMTGVPDTFYPGSFFQLGNTLFTHSVLGLYRLNAGNTWEDISPPGSRLRIYQTADSLIFGVERYYSPNSLVYRSADQGQTWDTVIVAGNIQQLYFFGSTPGRLSLWLRVSGSSVVKILQSLNAGKNWSQVDSLTNGSGDGAFQIGNRVFWPGFQSGFGVYFSDNGGLNRSFSKNGIPADLANGYLFHQGASVFILGESQGKQVLLKTDDNGSNWTPAPATPPNHYAVLPTDDAIYLVNDFNKLYRSADFGASWAQVGFPAKNDYRPTYIWQSANRLMLYGEGGIYASADNGLNWTSDGEGLQPYPLNAEQMALQNGNLYAGTNAGLLRSADQGANWKLLQNQIPRLPQFYFYQHQFLASPSTVLMATPEGIFRSVNNGDDWQATSFSTAFPDDSPWIFAREGAVWWMCSQSDKIYRSDDDGLSWDYVSTLPTTSSENLYFLLATNDGLICGGTSRYFVSSNGGLDWETRKYTGITGLSVACMRYDGGKYFISGSSSNSLFIGKSDDLVNWTKIVVDASGPGRTSETLLAQDSLLIVPFVGRGIYFSQNHGETWSKIPGSEVEALSVVPALVMDQDYLYAGTYFYGVWRYPLGGIIVKAPELEAGGIHRLSVHPNPAREGAALTYALTQASKVLITLNDLTGKQIAVLAKGWRQSGAVEETLVFPAELPAGCYFLSVNTALGTAALRVVLE